MSTGRMGSVGGAAPPPEELQDVNPLEEDDAVQPPSMRNFAAAAAAAPPTASVSRPEDIQVRGGGATPAAKPAPKAAPAAGVSPQPVPPPQQQRPKAPTTPSSAPQPPLLAASASMSGLSEEQRSALVAQQLAALRSVRGEFDFLSVPDWVMLHPLLGAYLAEAIGTFAFVLTIALVQVNNTMLPGRPDTNMTPLPIGFMLMCMVFTFGYISGGHFNPAVTLAVWLARKIDLKRAVGYVICQSGASLGAGLVAMIIQGNNDIVVPAITSTDILSKGLFAELIYTFALATVVLNVAYSRQKGNFFYGFAIGMTVSAGSAAVGNVSGGVFNPAVATGLQVAVCLTGKCDAITNFWLYWIAPAVGATLASIVFSNMYQPLETRALNDDAADV